jgi:hypothetical protein
MDTSYFWRLQAEIDGFFLAIVQIVIEELEIVYGGLF